jgi:hypothetical protein
MIGTSISSRICEIWSRSASDGHDPEPAVADRLHDALTDQVKHRLADRRGRDVEALGQRGRRVDLSGLQLPGHDGGLQGPGDLLAQAVGADCEDIARSSKTIDRHTIWLPDLARSQAMSPRTY